MQVRPKSSAEFDHKAAKGCTNPHIFLIIFQYTITVYSIHSVAMVFFPANNLSLEEENIYLRMALILKS